MKPFLLSIVILLGLASSACAQWGCYHRCHYNHYPLLYQPRIYYYQPYRYTYHYTPYSYSYNYVW